jgi:hypothetical protein
MQSILVKIATDVLGRTKKEVQIKGVRMWTAETKKKGEKQKMYFMYLQNNTENAHET